MVIVPFEHDMVIVPFEQEEGRVDCVLGNTPVLFEKEITYTQYMSR